MLIIQERVEVPRPQGALSGILAYPEDADGRARAVVSCPHPFLGGNAENPVVQAIANGFLRAGAVTLVWEYRQPGDGADLAGKRAAFWNDHAIAASAPGDVEDATAALRWLADCDLGRCPRRMLAGGYSYGGAISLLLAGETVPAFAVSPPLRALPADWRIRNPALSVLFAEDDIALSVAEVQGLQARSAGELESVDVLEGADHFLADRLEEVAARARAWLGLQCG